MASRYLLRSAPPLLLYFQLRSARVIMIQVLEKKLGNRKDNFQTFHVPSVYTRC